MWAFHDSRNSAYRFPFGAMPTGGSVRISIDVGGDSGASCTLRTWIDGEGEGFLPMNATQEGDHLRFSCDFTREDPAIVWYSFAIERSDGRVVRYGAQGAVRVARACWWSGSLRASSSRCTARAR